MFKGEILVGLAAVITGVKNNVFSANINTRKSYNSTTRSDLDHILHGAISPPWLLRKTLESANFFEEAVSILNSTYISAPVYYIIGGMQKNQGVIIERDHIGVNGFYQLNETNWFMV